MSGRGAYYKAKYGGGGGRGRGRGGSIGGPNEGHRRTKLENAGTGEDLGRAASSKEGAPYPAYHDLLGSWHFPNFAFILDHVQADPYASPSKARIRIEHQHAGFPSELWKNKIRNIALADYLTRALHEQCSTRGYDTKLASGGWSGGKGGQIEVEAPGQQVLERTSVIITSSSIEVRLLIGLPARGRSIMGYFAAQIFTEQIPALVSNALTYAAHDSVKLRAHIDCVEDQHHLRKSIAEAGLVAFVPNGAVLPRASGASDKPLMGKEVVSFQSPPHIERTFELPNRGEIRGMAIPSRSVTVLAGGGYHGKSTLLAALALGCYNHIPGDGREFISCVESVSTVRSEDGRSVASVDISPFINNLPSNRDTHSFSTSDASGSTSCAASFIEALELGSELICLDEDTVATNFLIRDARMQRLIGAELEPITPLVHKIRALIKEQNTSIIIVVGGCGGYLDVADLVLQMEHYRIHDVTARAKEIVAELPSSETSYAAQFGHLRPRGLIAPSVLPSTNSASGDSGGAGGGSGKQTIRGLHTIQHGDTTLDLSALSQLIHSSQTRAIGAALKQIGSNSASAVIYAHPSLRGMRTLAEHVQALTTRLDAHGMDALQEGNTLDGFLARPRSIEIGAALNRLRSARFSL